MSHADPTSLAGSMDLLESALAAAPVEWGRFDLPLVEFAARVSVLVARRLHREGVPATPDTVRGALQRTARVDLAVAVACDLGCPGAWEALAHRLLPRLCGLARKRGMTDADADSLASDVLAEMAMPRGGAREGILIGTFDGTGSLFGWSAVILVRRLSRLRRPTPAPRRTEADPTADPAELLRDADDARGFERDLRKAWVGLSGRERLALAWRYLDGLAQTEIAGLLRLSTARTSRVVTGAVDKLRAAVGSGGPAGEGSPALWAALAEVVRKNLATAGATAPLPDREGSSPDEREA